jgi:hypothetical protein
VEVPAKFVVTIPYDYGTLYLSLENPHERRE